jgi:hypothetical protein
MSGDNAARLESLINRLDYELQIVHERLQRDDAGAAGAYWVGDKNQEAQAQENLHSGYLHFQQALGTARGALASEDPELIEVALSHCNALERDGLILAARFDYTIKRRKGGKTTGTQQTADAVERYRPLLPRYRELIAKGKSHSTAVHIIQEELKTLGTSVSTKTLGHWLKKLEGS